MQTNAYLRSIGKTRLGKTPKAVKLSTSPYDEDHYGMPAENPWGPLFDPEVSGSIPHTYNRVEPPIRSAGETIVEITKDAAEQGRDALDTISSGLDWIDWWLPDPGDLPETTIIREGIGIRKPRDHVTVLPAPKREQSVNMFTAIAENPTMKIGEIEEPGASWSANSATLLSALELTALLPRQAGGLPNYYGGVIQGIADGEKYSTTKKVPWGFGWDELTYQEVAQMALSGGSFGANKPIIGMFSQNMPTILWPWTTSADAPNGGGRRYTAVDFAEMPFFESGVANKIKAPIELVMGRQYNKVGDLPAYGAWGDIVLGLPGILIIAAGITFGAPYVQKLGKDTVGFVKSQKDTPHKIMKAVTKPIVDIKKLLKRKWTDFKYPRMKLEGGSYKPAVIELPTATVVGGQAQRMGMWLQKNGPLLLLGGVGIAALTGVGMAANEQWGITQKIENEYHNQKRQATTTMYMPPHHPDYKNWLKNNPNPN